MRVIGRQRDVARSQAYPGRLAAPAEAAVAGAGQGRRFPQTGAGLPVGAERAGMPSIRLLVAQLALVVFCVAVVIRLLLTDIIINVAYPYTSAGGNIILKIHPGNYLFALSAVLLYIGPGIRFAAADVRVLRWMAIVAAVLVGIGAQNVLQGRTGSVGYIVDNYLATLMAATVLLAMPYPWRVTVVKFVFGALIFNAMVATGEYAAGRYVIPGLVQAAEFRPTGFLGAALNVGVINLCATLMLLSLRMPAWFKLLAVTLMLLGIFISASRTAMLVSAVTVPLAILINASLRKEGASIGVSAVLMLLAGIFLVPLLFVTASELGFLDRFSGGYLDDSAQTRILVYKVFDYVSWRDILFGADALRIRDIINFRLGIEHIESSIVVFTFNFGLVGFVVFSFCFLMLLFRLAQGTHPLVGLGLVAFLALALSNNTLSTKVPSLFAAITLAIGVKAYHVRRYGADRPANADP